VTRIDPGVVSLVAELRGHERQATEELCQWKTGGEERKPLDSGDQTGCATASLPKYSPPMPRRPTDDRGWMA
jgi:hypothetical protein